MFSIFAVMNIICQHIEFLVRNHDCVIVPRWGAFIANYQPAHFDSQNRLLPPMRTISFNSSLVHDDGLLASSIVRRESLSYDKALNIINDEVNTMRHQFNVQGIIMLGHLGTFTKNDEGSMIFEPIVNSSATASLYGLPIVNVVSVLSQAQQDANILDNKKSDTIYLPIRRSWTRIAASIAIILGLGFTLSTPMINDQVHQASMVTTPVKPKIELIQPAPDAQLVLNVANFDTLQAKAEVDTLQRKQYQAVMAYYKQREERRKARREEMLRQIEEYRKAMNEAKAKKSEIVSQNLQNDNNASIPATSIRFNASDEYCLIVASLPTKALAERFIAESGNGNFGILEKDGRYRVYAATGTTSNQAYAIARDNGLFKRYKGAWVCRK